MEISKRPVEQVSLVTGKVISKFTLPSDLSPIGYTKPDGLNLLAISDEGKLIRYDLQGHRQLVLGSSASFPTTAADGAWELGSRLYVQAEISCPFIDQVWQSSSVHPVKVPGIRAALMADSFGGRLLVTGSPQCQSASGSLFWFNPSTQALSYVFHPRGASLGVVRVAPFGLQATF